MAYSAFINPIYQPAMRIISAITNATTVTVTTSFAHLYVSGTIVRFDIPVGFGMEQINQQFGPITVTGSTTFTMPIDTTNYDVFQIPSYALLPSGIVVSLQQAQCVPIGELSGQLTAAVQNTLPH